MTSSTKQRIQVSLSEKARKAVPALARERRLPAATLVSHLIDEALEISEDAALIKIASERDAKGVVFVSHEDAWK